MNINGLELPAVLAANLREAEYKLSANQQALLRKRLNQADQVRDAVAIFASSYHGGTATRQSGLAKTPGSPYLFQAVWNGREIRLRLNDFPDEPFCTLLAGAREIQIEEFPKGWTLPRHREER